MFQLAGVPAVHSAYVQFRIIDAAEEAPPGSQYDGDFWGVYLMLEQPDGRFLAALSDVVAVVIKWGSTPVAAATSSLNLLRTDGINPVGVICTQVDPSARSVGGLYYYSKQYSDYYQDA